MTDEALDQYARRLLLDVLRTEWDGTGQDRTFVPSKRYQNEMRELVANPEAWYRKKAEPPWRKYARRLSALAALAAVCALAVWYLPGGVGRSAARSLPSGVPAAVLLALALLAAVAALLIRVHGSHKNK